MNSNNLISIIVPTHNRAWCIERAIKSILDQSSKNWELIIVDDGSTDNTQEVVNTYLSDSRISYFHKENGGVGSARNFGVSKAKAKYVTFLDSDDELMNNAIFQMEKDIPLLSKKNVSILLYFAKKTTDARYIDLRFNDLQVITYEDAIKGLWPKIETLQLMPKEIFNFVTFPELGNGLELILWFNILKKHGNALVRTRYLRIYHTKHDTRLTGSKSIISRSKTMPLLYEVYFDEFEKDYIRLNKSRLAYYYTEKGVFELIDGKKKIGRGSLLKACGFNKSKLLVIMTIYIASFLPASLFCRLTIWAHSFKKIIK